MPLADLHGKCECWLSSHMLFTRFLLAPLQATWRNQNEPAFQDAIGRVVLEGARVSGGWAGIWAIQLELCLTGCSHQPASRCVPAGLQLHATASDGHV